MVRAHAAAGVRRGVLPGDDAGEAGHCQAADDPQPVATGGMPKEALVLARAAGGVRVAHPEFDAPTIFGFREVR
eukprot:CAMPEP_0179212342 /NCGR_PEP_ID=MMETSP0797-20121207/1062_1 /TAXON_ID=47934 /ORGANISM="Dinophysis acuminata, Strain DAEP01" /LENGTH=73 /DNA_ID=CAMNT_0020917963 /DNA_START=235 /DNA_END=453 /DNA_ORIENTATION=+